MKKLTSLLLALTLLGLSGCSAGKEKSFLSYGKQSVSAAAFGYLCSLEKTNFLFEIHGKDPAAGGTSSLTDNPQFWVMQDKEGNSMADSLKTSVLFKLQLMLYLAQLAEEKGGALTDSDKDSVKAYLDKQVSAFKDKREFNEYMKTYGVSYDILYRYYLVQALSQRGEDLLFGEGGALEISEATAQERFRSEYVTVGCIYINNIDKSYPNGKVVFLPEAEKAEKEALAEEILARLQGGEDFDALFDQFSETPSQGSAGQSLTFRKDGFGGAEAETEAFALKTGQLSMVKTDKGIYILKKLPLNSAYFQNEKSAIVALLKELEQVKLVDKNIKGYTLDQGAYDAVDVASIPFVR